MKKASKMLAFCEVVAGVGLEPTTTRLSVFEPKLEMNFPMAVRTNKYALVKFSFNCFPRFVVSTSRHAEIFLCWVSVVKFQCTNALAVSTLLTTTAFVLNCLNFDFCSAAFHRLIHAFATTIVTVTLEIVFPLSMFIACLYHCSTN